MNSLLDRRELDGRAPEPVPGGSEQVVLCWDRQSGIRAVIAIDDTTLGPGLGGVRYVPYPDEDAAVAEARRLARVMTLKNACADIPYGGAKSVIMKGDGEAPRRDVMRTFGRFVGRLGGAYVPGVDMGTTVEDLATIGEVATDVSCDHADPSPYTARGVLAALEAAVAAAGYRGLEGIRVLVQGTGHVGHSLAVGLAQRGADLLVADVDPARAATVARRTGGRVVPVAEVVETDCDVLAPCAIARLIDDVSVERLSCRIVVGAANDVLAHRRLDRRLAERGVLYVPDFVANAGGVVQIHAGRAGWSEERTGREVARIGERVGFLLAEAAGSGRTPLEVAEALASERVGHSVEIPA